jgi:S1-C subfamily serine protease
MPTLEIKKKSLLFSAIVLCLVAVISLQATPKAATRHTLPEQREINLAEQLSYSSVYISTGSGFGSGTVLNKSWKGDMYHLILTAGHVTKGVDNILVASEDKREYPAEVIIEYTNWKRDDFSLLLVDRINQEQFYAPVIVFNEYVKRGQWLYNVSTEWEVPDGWFGFNRGHASYVNRDVEFHYKDYIDWSGDSLLAGSSGSGVFNSSGEFVAMQVIGHPRKPGTAILIPVTRLRKYLDAHQLGFLLNGRRTLTDKQAKLLGIGE